jgi:hypothetical protein
VCGFHSLLEGSFEGLIFLFGIELSFLDFFIGSLDGVDASDVVPEIFLYNFFDGFVFIGGVVKSSSESIAADGKEFLIYFFGVFGVFLVLYVTNKEFQVVEKQVLIVSGGLEIVFEYFF